MPKFTVDVKAFINVTVEAPDAQLALGRAERFVEWLSPTVEQVADYLTDHPEGIVDGGSFGVDGDSDVEEADA